MALFLMQAKPSGSLLLCGLQRNWGETPTSLPARKEHPNTPASTTLSSLCGMLG